MGVSRDGLAVGFVARLGDSVCRPGAGGGSPGEQCVDRPAARLALLTGLGAPIARASGIDPDRRR